MESFLEANFTRKFGENFSRVGWDLKPKAKPEGRQVPILYEGKTIESLCTGPRELVLWTLADLAFQRQI